MPGMPGICRGMGHLAAVALRYSLPLVIPEAACGYPGSGNRGARWYASSMDRWLPDPGSSAGMTIER